MRLTRFFPLLILLVFSNACVEPLSVPTSISEPRLVVDALITDQPGPYTVKLFMSSNANQNLNKPNYVTHAKVTITDDLGHDEILIEGSAGQYHTTAMQGTVGRKYQLFITTSEDKRYQSSEAELLPPGEIQNLYWEFEENSINQNDLTLPQDAFWVYLDAKGETGQQNYFRWRWTGTYHAKTFPELHIGHLGPSSFPDPLPCSGYIVGDNGVERTDTCTCCDCWAPQFNSNVLLSKNDFLGEDAFARVLVSKIPIDRRLFYEKYYVEVEQLRFSEDVYDFWKLVSAQQQGTGSIFQPNAVKVKGNIHCVSDPNEEVLGVFSAASVTTKGLFIDRKELPKQIPVVDTLTVDCRKFFEGSTNQKPPFW
jgi:hypothetical protein